MTLIQSIDVTLEGGAVRSSARRPTRTGEEIMQTLYSSTGKNSTEAWQSWFTTVSQEFYDGEHDGELNDPLDLTFDKAMAYPISLTHLTSRAPVGFRRSWQHIRNNKVGTR